MSLKQYKILISNAQHHVYNTPTDIISANNRIEEIVFVSHKSPNSEISVVQNGVNFPDPREGDWVGTIDAYNSINDETHKVNWTFNWRVSKASEKDYVSTVAFPLDKLHGYVFKNKKYGNDIKQTLFALWLKNNCDIIARLNLKTSIIYKEAGVFAQGSSDELSDSIRANKSKYLVNSINGMKTKTQAFSVLFKQENASMRSSISDSHRIGYNDREDSENENSSVSYRRSESD